MAPVLRPRHQPRLFYNESSVAPPCRSPLLPQTSGSPMAPLLRSRKLTCFYCHRASAQKQDGTVYKWPCHHCGAENHLDQFGDHAYPPASESSPNGVQYAQYAQYARRPNSPEFLPTAHDPFCSQCLQNQYLMNQCIAGYLPEDIPESDPQYKIYEQRFPAYLEELEQRYPQVCVTCEPGARDILSRRHRAVKADNMRRVIERSKNGGLHSQMMSWKEWAVMAGGLSYWSSILVQLLWNLLGAMGLEFLLPQSFFLLFRSPVESYRVLILQQRSSESYTLSSAGMAPAVGWGLVLSIVSLWWNPKLRKKLTTARARTVGLNDYYKLQITVVIARFAVWVILQDPVSFAIRPGLEWAIHLVSFALIALTTIMSHVIVKLDVLQISWNESPESLLSRKPLTRSQDTLGAPPRFGQPLYKKSGSTTHTSGFPMHKVLGARPDNREEYSLPTPPIEAVYDDDDAMDWAPSQELSISQDSRIYQESNGNLFGSIDLGHALPVEKKQPPPRPQHRIDFSDEPPTPLATREYAEPRSYAPLSHPKLMQQDTGLEDIFTSFFSLGPDPSEAQSPPKSPFRGKMDLQIPQKSLSQNYLALALYIGLLTTWNMGYWLSSIDKASIGISVMLTGSSLRDTLKIPNRHRSPVNLLIFFAELVIAILLGRVVFQGEHNIIWDQCTQLFLGALALQEIVQVYGTVSFRRRLMSRGGARDIRFEKRPIAFDSRPSSQSSNEEVTFSLRKKDPFAPPKLFASLATSEKPPSSSPFFDPRNPPTLASKVYPTGTDRHTLLFSRPPRHRPEY